MQGTILHKRLLHASFAKEIEYVCIKYLYTIVNIFVYLVHPKPIQNIIATMYVLCLQ